MIAIEVSVVGLVTAMLAGAISFVSNGVDPSSTRMIDRLRVTWPALWFVAGFTTVFVLLGLGPGGAYLLGLAFAFGWTPCIGPVLGSILTVSALSAGSGAGLLAAYGLGLGVPFLLAAILFANMAAVLKQLGMPVISSMSAPAG